MLKENCPICSSQFPLLGPKKLRESVSTPKSKLVFTCSTCSSRLNKVVYRDEALAYFISSLMLFTYAVLSVLWGKEYQMAKFISISIGGLAFLYSVSGINKKKHYVPEQNA